MHDETRSSHKLLVSPALYVGESHKLISTESYHSLTLFDFGSYVFVRTLGNTCSTKLIEPKLSFQRIMASMHPKEWCDGTIEGDILPGPITFYRLQGTAEGGLRAYAAEGDILPVATRSFGSIGVFGIKEFGRFYRHWLIGKRFPHHGAVMFGHYGKVLYETLKFLGVESSEIGYNHPAGDRYEGENPF